MIINYLLCGPCKISYIKMIRTYPLFMFIWSPYMSHIIFSLRVQCENYHAYWIHLQLFLISSHICILDAHEEMKILACVCCILDISPIFNWNALYTCMVECIKIWVTRVEILLRHLLLFLFFSIRVIYLFEFYRNPPHPTPPNPTQPPKKDGIVDV